MSQASPPGLDTVRERPSLPLDRPRRRTGGSSARRPGWIRMPIVWRALLGITVLSEILLLLIALVPQSIWASLGYPSGPIPDALAPLVAGAFYSLPALTGALCSRWQLAVVLATLPAWLDLGIFAVAAARHIGPFYLVQDPHAESTVGTLELFAVLGALGWLARTSLLGLLARGKGGRS